MWRKTPFSFFAANQLHSGHFETTDIVYTLNNAQPHCHNTRTRARTYMRICTCYTLVELNLARNWQGGRPVMDVPQAGSRKLYGQEKGFKDSPQLGDERCIFSD